MTSEPTSFSASAIHSLIGEVLTFQLEEYLELWGKVQEYGKTASTIPKEEQFGDFIRTFGYSVYSSQMIIPLISCTYIEGLINFYLSSKTDKMDFSIIEKKSLLNKWTTVPKRFIPAYELSNNDQLYRDLSELISWRNSIVHSKPLFVIGKERIHEGNMPKEWSDGHAFTIRSAFLSEKLVKHLWKFDKSSVILLLTRRLGDELYQFLISTK